MSILLKESPDNEPEIIIDNRKRTTTHPFDFEGFFSRQGDILLLQSKFWNGTDLSQTVRKWEKRTWVGFTCWPKCLHTIRPMPTVRSVCSTNIALWQQVAAGLCTNYTSLHSTWLHCTALHYTALYFTALHYGHGCLVWAWHKMRDATVTLWRTRWWHMIVSWWWSQRSLTQKWHTNDDIRHGVMT